MFITDLFQKWNINSCGIIHIGAHLCEEREIYARAGCDDSKVIWIEGNPQIYSTVKSSHLPVIIYNALISDKEEDVDFIVTNNNGMSSSFLELKEHLIEHPDCIETQRLKLRTTTLPKLLKDNSIDPSNYDFLIMDIQGAELHALRGMTEILHNFKHIYLEVNTKELYANCGQLPEVTQFLEQYGFIFRDIHMTPHGWGDAYFSKNIFWCKRLYQ